MFKKIIICIITSVMLLTTFAGCETSTTKSNKKFSIVCTIFPEYDWTKEILGEQAENADITYLLDKGIDLHNYQPSADDMVKISECDLFIYVGGESDAWVDDALSTAKNKNMKVINLMEVMGNSAKEEVVKEGMMPEDEEESEETDEEPEYDEHFWTSLRNAEIFCNKISEALCEIDDKHSEIYKKNLSDYNSKLDDMDKRYQSMIDNAPVKTLIFGDRFPFRYFVDDYGLDYYAAFVGCSAETEASFETISFLANKVDELNAETIFVIENSDMSIAKSIIKNTKYRDQSIAELNSMQSVTSDMISDGTTYLGLMEKNYDVLKEALYKEVENE